MEPFIRISDFGAIRILGIPFAAHADTVKEHFKGYEIEENENCVCVKKVSFDNLPSLDIMFVKNEEGRIIKALISSFSLNKKECDIAFDYFKEKLKQLNLFLDEKDSSKESIIFSNCLHRVSLFKQNGISKNQNIYPLNVTIECRLMGVSDDKRYEAIRDLYINESSYKIDNIESKIQFLKSKIVKPIIVLIILIIIYLFALNGRYSHTNGGLYFDKWTNNAVYFNDDTGRFEIIK